MEEFLTKLNIVKKTNYINQLERNSKKDKERIEKYISNFKKEITEQELKKRQYLQTIQELSEKNKKLQNINTTYKSILDKIPNWVVRFFAGKKNIGGYLNG